MFERIEFLCGRTQRIRDLADTTERKLFAAIAEAVESIQGDRVRENELLSLLYWHPIEIPSQLLERAFRAPIQGLAKRVSAFPADVSCSFCGFNGCLQAKTRSKLIALKKSIARGDYHLCADCHRAQLFIRYSQSQQHAKWLASEDRKRQRLNELRTMPYDDYLQTPEWMARREAARKAAGHRCQVCHSKGPLDVHHRTYERRGCELPSDLTVLCRRCHETFHRNGAVSRTG